MPRSFDRNDSDTPPASANSREAEAGLSQETGNRGADPLKPRSTFLSVGSLLSSFSREGLGADLARGATWSLVINFAGLPISFLLHLLLARTLQAEQYGVYIYAMAWMQIGKLVGSLELNTASIRFVGEYYGREDWPLLRGFLRWSHRVVVGASAFVAVAVAVAVWLYRDAIEASLASTYLAACMLLLPTTLLALKSSVVQGYKKVRRSKAPDQLVRPVLFVLGIACVAYLLGIQLQAADAVLLSTLATCLALALAWVFQKSAEPEELVHAHRVYQSRLWLSTSFGFVWISGAQLILSHQIDVLIVGSYLDTTQAGVYGLASQIGKLLRISGAAIIFVALPYVADFHARGDKKTLQNVVKWTTAAGTILGVAGFLGIVVLGRFVLAWFGPGFADAYGVLIILSIVWVLESSFGGLSGFLLTLTGHQNHAGMIIVLSALGNLALMAILIPQYGILGAATATMLANTLKQLAFAWAAKKYVGVNVFAFLKAPWGRR